MTFLSKTTYFVITLMCGAIALSVGSLVSANDFIVEEDAGMLVEHSSSSDFIVEEDVGM